MAFAGVLHAGAISILALAAHPTWRIVTISALFAVFAFAQRQLVSRVQHPNCIESSFISINLVVQLFAVSCATLTGGLLSPFLPALLLPSVVSLLYFGPISAARWIMLCNGLLVGVMVLLPDSVLGPRLNGVAYTSLSLLALAWSIVILHSLAGKLARAADRARDSYDCLREEHVVAAEARLARMQSVGAKVAHELKTPLASIKDLLHRVATAPEGDRTREHLSTVASEIGRMETILHEYLSFSRPLEELHPERFDLTALARDVLDALAGRAEQARVTLAMDAGAIQVHGDPRRLKEALINVVTNAIEATPSGGSVQLRLRSASGKVTLEVEDTGCGIAACDLERLGTACFTTRPNGTGLGVILARAVIAQHGGSLAYRSRIGEGTTATISFASKPDADPTGTTCRDDEAREQKRLSD